MDFCVDECKLNWKCNWKILFRIGAHPIFSRYRFARTDTDKIHTSERQFWPFRNNAEQAALIIQLEEKLNLFAKITTTPLSQTHAHTHSLREMREWNVCCFFDSIHVKKVGTKGEISLHSSSLVFARRVGKASMFASHQTKGWRNQTEITIRQQDADGEVYCCLHQKKGNFLNLNSM